LLIIAAYSSIACYKLLPELNLSQHETRYQVTMAKGKKHTLDLGIPNEKCEGRRLCDAAVSATTSFTVKSWHVFHYLGAYCKT
jgi:hypothetical protein